MAVTNLPGRRVLVADDDKETREVLVALLRRAGHDVVGAADGQEAIDLYRARPFDVLVLDLLMPKLDGVQTLRILKGEFPEARVLVISGAWHIDGRDVLEYARELGAAAAVLKPIVPRVIRLAVEELLALNR
jgi:CheY-like chemotaxis protein